MSEPATPAEAQLARKKRTRSRHRGSTTRLLNQAATALEAEELDAERLSHVKWLLDEKVGILKGLDGELAEIVPVEELEEEIQGADEYMEGVYEVLAKPEKALRPGSPRPRPAVTGTDPPPLTDPEPIPAGTPRTERTLPTDEPAAADGTERSAATGRVDSDTTRSTTSPVSDRVKLPKINLPHFRGNLTRWTAFWDSFNAAVHLNGRLSEIDKFNYLRSLLEGTAYDAIAGMALSAVNYREAIEILKKRFGNKQLTISKHMESLLSVNAVASDHHLRDLRRLYDQAESNIRSLKSLGVAPKSYGAKLSSVLLTKLPPDLCLIVSRKVSAEDLDMENILNTFEQELVARERASHSVVPPARCTQNQGRSSTSAFVAASAGSQSPSCVFCHQSHSAVNCTEMQNVEARKTALRSSSRCFNCLRRNHLSRNCRSMSKCKHCNGRHHTAICHRGSQSGEGAGQELNNEAPAFTPDPTTSTLCSTKGKAILLQTACTVVYNFAKPRQAIKVRLLLDSGSQQSYVTERVGNLLQLKPTGAQTLSIATFGAVQDQVKVCPVVSVGMRLKGYPNTSLSLHVVPTICEPIACQPITASIEANNHLMSLDLADSADGTASLPVDILIGCDHYWYLVTGKISHGEKGPTAIHTKLGWVLCGPVSSSHHGTRSSSCVVTTHLLRVDSQLMESTQLSEQLRAFWELESLGIHIEEKTLYDEFAGSITFEDGRYKIPLPWKESHGNLNDNYHLSLNRLNGLLRCLRRSPDILKQYDATFQDQLAKGIVEHVSPEEETTNLVHYLPHHGVIRSDKATTKLRVVYDASSKGPGPSIPERVSI